MNSDEAMGQPRLRTSLHMNAVATLSLVILFHTALHAQERRNDVVITADGMEYIGHIVVDSTTYIRWIRPGGEIDYLQFRSGLRRPGATQDKILVGDGSGTWVEGTIKDTTHGMIYIRERDGTLDTLIRRGDEVYSSLELVRMEPERGIDYGDSLPLPGPDTCYARTRPWYFLEMRVLGVKEKSSLDPGAECALGFRIGSFGIGLGASRLKLDDAWRTPGFLHLKYYFSENCVKPILYADAGYVFDSFTDKYNSKASIFTAAPKIVGLGLGLDIRLTSLMDLSFDGGYRYFTVATDRLAPACVDRYVLGYDELHTGYLRIGVTF